MNRIIGSAIFVAYMFTGCAAAFLLLASFILLVCCIANLTGGDVPTWVFVAMPACLGTGTLLLAAANWICDRGISFKIKSERYGDL